MTKKDLYKELKAITLLSLGIALFCLITYLFKYLTDTFIRVLLIYLSFIVLLHIITLFVKNKFFKKLLSIIYYPLGILYALLTIVIPFGAIVIHIFFYFALAFFIPEIFYLIIRYIHIIELKNTAPIIYLKLTSTVFISVILNPILREIVYKISPLRLKSSNHLKPYELEKHSNYILSIDNIKFLVYGVYVIIIIAMNFLNLQGLSYNGSLDNDKAILQSFVTFIAFDRAFTLIKQLDFKPSIFLNNIIQSVYSVLKDETKEEESN